MDLFDTLGTLIGTSTSAGMVDSETGRIAIYYGCADSYVGVAYTTAQEIYDYILKYEHTSDDDKSLGRR